MSIRIFTDSASDVPQGFHPMVTVMPLVVTFGDKQYLDGVDLSHREFYEKLIEGDDLPRTSQINPMEFEQAFQQAVDAGEDAIVLPVSSKLSGTYDNACLAAKGFRGHVWVVDSENAALGLGILVRRAVQLAQSGLTAAEVAERLEREKKDVRLVALLDTLEYLKRGGRLSAQAAFVGGLLSIKPVVAIRDGEVVVLGKARGSRNGSNLLIKEVQSTTGIDFDRPFLLAYTGLSDELLQKYIRDSSFLWEGQTDELPIASIGGAIGTHIGPGAVAVAFFQKEV